MAVTRAQFLKTAAAAPLGAVPRGGGPAQTTGTTRSNVILMSDLGSAAPKYALRTRRHKYIYPTAISTSSTTWNPIPARTSTARARRG